MFQRGPWTWLVAACVAACSLDDEGAAVSDDAGAGAGGSGGSEADAGSGGAGGDGGDGGAVAGAGGESGSGGAAGSGGGGGTSAASGSAGSGGSMSAPCTDADGVDPSVQGTASGTNGVETDSCTAEGNLVEFFCQVDTTGCFPNPPPNCGVITGIVQQRVYECGGTCVDGTCEGRCPAFDDRLVVESVEASTGNAVFESEADGRTYACELTTDPPGMFNCKNGLVLGSGATVTSLGLMVAFCTHGPIGNLGITADAANGEACTYSCSVSQ